RSVIAACIGALETDLLKQAETRRIRPATNYLYLFLAGHYCYALYAPEVWNKLGMLVFCSMLAYALWQKVRDQAPYLLDPGEKSPPRLSLSTGMITGMIFFVFQGVILALSKDEGEPADGQEFMIAFASAGLVTTFFSLVYLSTREIDRLPEKLGLCTDDGAACYLTFGAVREGVAFGVIGFGFALAYLWGIEHWRPLILMKEAMPDIYDISKDDMVCFTILAVLLAPFCEEYIFRGLIFRGMRRSIGLWPAALGSAALFAFVHPPISIIPVFVLGTLTAIAFERTRLLLTPIIVHAVYNAAICLVNLN
ncbi:MAG: CPBP family intramembrane metalloprotease, partial [Planctomycetes bacterium]|nr:CPBP family intramembrane metalloprotease [Planctomycetota bacterium]